MTSLDLFIVNQKVSMHKGPFRKDSGGEGVGVGGDFEFSSVKYGCNI